MAEFTNKKIAVLGLGIEGQDICKFLIKHRAKNITLFDQKTPKELGDTYQNFKFQISNFKLGPDYLKGGLTDFDMIFRSPALKLSLPEIAEAKKKGSIVTSATKLFFDLCPAKIIGVTGTKGKGTTATLIYNILRDYTSVTAKYKILKKAGLPANRRGKKVFLAGNIGQPMLGLLSQLEGESWVVLELSSFQLQDLDKSPHIAVVLFITSEHLDYHRNVKEYTQAKSNIVQHQKGSDWAVLNADNPLSKSFCLLTKAKVHFFSRQQKTNGAYIRNDQIFLREKLIGKTSQLRLKGEHNWDNVCAAITASALAGANITAIKKTVFSFKGLDHRLELVKHLKGVDFYNDTFSTTPETAIAAIKAFKKPIILIAGGSEKGSDYTQLGQEITKNSVRTLILIGQMAERIKKAVEKANFKGEIVYQPREMKEIIEIAFEKSRRGDVILLSPACASFDMFANYKERGRQFKKYAHSL